MGEKPKVFRNTINKSFNNNKNTFYSKNNIAEEKTIKDSKTIVQKINEIFASPNYIYKANVKITTKEGVITKRIIGRNKDYIITMDNKLIPIKDIIDIKSQKK